MYQNINTYNMRTRYNLEIKKPCLENYNDFKPTQLGGFCDSCQKEVIDFTKFKNKDIASYFKTHNSQNICGRLTTFQLNDSYESARKKNKYLSFFTGVALILLSLFSTNSASAQEATKTTNTTSNNSDKEALKNLANISVEGTVTTKEDGLVLPGAIVMLQGTSRSIQTDFDGYFKFPIKLKKGDVLLISYVGFETQKVIIENKKSISNIELKLDMSICDAMVVGKVAVKEVFKSKKN